MRDIGVAVFGAGFWANEMHLPVLSRLPGVSVRGIASGSEEHARRSAERFGIPRWTTDYRELLDDPSVDVVDILAPNNLHAPMAIAAAQANKHVMCIKPLALTMGEARQIEAAVNDAGTRFFYAENVPFIPALLRTREIIDEGALGNVFRVKACEGIGAPPNKWLFDPKQSGGGAIIDMAVHSLAFCRWMAGDEIETVYAQAGTYVHQSKTANEDTATLLLRFRNGVIGQCEDSWSLSGAMDSRFEVFGTGGRILIDNLHRQPIQVVSDVGYAYWGGPKEGGRGWTFPLALPGDVNDGQYAMLAHFIDCLRSSKPSRSELADGIAILATVEAAYKSLKSKTAESVMLTNKEDLMTARQEMRVGMISWAHVHAEFRSKALQEIPGVRIVAIADENEARGRENGKKLGVANVYQDWRKVIEQSDVDVVFIHSENNRHADQAVLAAEAGKDIFCEKPMATTLEDANRMVEAAHRHNVQLTVAFVSRFAKEAERAKRIVDTGVLGDIVSARSVIGLAGIKEIGCPPEMDAWMSDPAAGGGGAWIDEGSHAVDLLRWLVGDIDSVSMMMNKKIKTHLAVEDEAIGVLRFKNGALGELNTSWSLAIDIGMRNAIELYGSKGSLFLESTSRSPKVEVYTESLSPELRGWVSPHITPDTTEPHDYQSWPPHVHHYKREISAFASRYLAGQLPYGPSGEDGRACLAVLLAGYQSAKKGAFVTVQEVLPNRA